MPIPHDPSMRARGCRNGVYVQAVKRLKEARGDFTAGWLVSELGLDSRRAHNALLYALRRGLIARTGVRGVYRLAEVA